MKTTISDQSHKYKKGYKIESRANADLWIQWGQIKTEYFF